ncbi:hypothetical protein HMPREF9554_02941 [Treponema phagedenis F0421]|nr:hypothetical protein HMPREF9554_02941 [Treponema phagedenis F0421]
MADIKSFYMLFRHYSQTIKLFMSKLDIFLTVHPSLLDCLAVFVYIIDIFID